MRYELDSCCYPKSSCCIKYGRVNGRQSYKCKRTGRRFIWGGKWYKYSDVLRRKAKEMYIHGMSIREISRELAIPYSTVRRWIRNL